MTTCSAVSLTLLPAVDAEVVVKQRVVDKLLADNGASKTACVVWSAAIFLLLIAASGPVSPLMVLVYIC